MISLRVPYPVKIHFHSSNNTQSVTVRWELTNEQHQYDVPRGPSPLSPLRFFPSHESGRIFDVLRFVFDVLRATKPAQVDGSPNIFANSDIVTEFLTDLLTTFIRKTLPAA